MWKPHLRLALELTHYLDSSVILIQFWNMLLCICQKVQIRITSVLCLDRSQKLSILATLPAMHIRAVVITTYTNTRLDRRGAVREWKCLRYFMLKTQCGQCPSLDVAAKNKCSPCSSMSATMANIDRASSPSCLAMKIVAYFVSPCCEAEHTQKGRWGPFYTIIAI